ncbi:hypothetical protein PBI_GRAY_78 [Gordonia phage Gray]|nr:hypothetical protein PBI_GRAY_78 [Gordonia phage Gray]
MNAPLSTVAVGEEVRHLSSTRSKRATAYQVQLVPVVRAVLIDTARRQTTITYGELCHAIQAFSPRSVGGLLDTVWLDCIKRGEPSLANLVVGTNGVPGSEFLVTLDRKKESFDSSAAHLKKWEQFKQDCYAYWAIKS